jgi:hypothetical protein
MTTFVQLLELLREAVAQPAMLATLVPKFQDSVWHSEISFPSQTAEDAARDLAYDLEYYAPDPKRRAEDSAYFGEERAVAEIRSALGMMEIHK